MTTIRTRMVRFQWDAWRSDRIWNSIWHDDGRRPARLRNSILDFSCERGLRNGFLFFRTLRWQISPLPFHVDRNGNLFGTSSGGPPLQRQLPGRHFRARQQTWGVYVQIYLRLYRGPLMRVPTFHDLAIDFEWQPLGSLHGLPLGLLKRARPRPRRKRDAFHSLHTFTGQRWTASPQARACPSIRAEISSASPPVPLFRAKPPSTGLQRMWLSAGHFRTVFRLAKSEYSLARRVGACRWFRKGVRCRKAVLSDQYFVPTLAGSGWIFFDRGLVRIVGPRRRQPGRTKYQRFERKHLHCA